MEGRGRAVFVSRGARAPEDGEFSSFTGGRVSYARQIAVMTVHLGKKVRVRGKQNVSRTCPSALRCLSRCPRGSPHPLLARLGGAFDPSRFHRSRLPFVYIYARFSSFCGFRGREPGTNEQCPEETIMLVHRSIKVRRADSIQG